TRPSAETAESRRYSQRAARRSIDAAATGRRATQGTRKTVSAPGPSRRGGVPIHPRPIRPDRVAVRRRELVACASGPARPALYSDRPRLFEKLWAIPGVRRHQTGDTEMRAVFPPDALEQVALVIKGLGLCGGRRARRPVCPRRLEPSRPRARRRGLSPDEFVWHDLNATPSARPRRGETKLPGPPGPGSER